MDMLVIVKRIFTPVLSWIYKISLFSVILLLLFILFFFITFFIKYRINPFKMNVDKLRSLQVKNKYHDLFRWLVVDMKTPKTGEFEEYGFTFYVGRQGAGKTTTMVEYLERMRKQYPKCKIATNFKYEHADCIIKDWLDFFHIRNGTDGVIFAIDEIHSEYSSESWKDFPENLLSEISQQRKQRIKIVTTCQRFTRCAKQLREQAFSVIVCKTFAKRLVKCTEYDADDYTVASSPKDLKKNYKSLNKYSYVMGDDLRNKFDTYEKIERMKKVECNKRSR